MRDGGLRAEFRTRFFEYQWTSVETFTLPGVPDSEYCTPQGISGWMEFKRTTAWKVTFEPFQPAWIDRRARYGGRVWLAVRRMPIARKWAGRDELWLVPGLLVLPLAHEGLDGISSCLEAHGGCIAGGIGPASWDWARVREMITGVPPKSVHS